MVLRRLKLILQVFKVIEHLISILVMNSQSLEDFICPICLEGDNGAQIRTHHCGLHDYHLPCLINLLRSDRRCAICRMTGTPNVTVTIIIPAVTYQHVTSPNWTCVLCHNYLIQNHSCYQINACNHRLHVFCFNHILMTLGITTTGGFHCPQCNEYM